jgi:Ala-tRNA(Pro) deacylase
MSSSTSIHEFLREARVPYTVVPHHPAFTAQEEAAATHVPGRDWAKVVVCVVDGHPVQAVVPATLSVHLERFLELTGGREIRIAREDELPELFPGCEPGAVPPFGPLYGQPIFVDVQLAAEPEIVFNAGSYTEAIAMRWSDFSRSLRPIVGNFSQQPRDHVGAYRLSYRE